MANLNIKTMFKITFLSLILIFCISGKITIAQDRTIVSKKDTITYRAQVWVEKEDLARYGGKEIFKKNLEKMFAQTTLFWNESSNKFNYYFRYVPAGLKIYDNNGNKDNYDEHIKDASGILDTEKYDFVVFFALNAKNNGMWCSGGGKSGQALVACYKTLEEQKKNGDIFSKVPPVQGVYSDLGHEFGHVRGATDMYQYIIKAKDNSVSRVDLVPPGCNMGTAFGAWSDYCSALFNYTAHHKQLKKDLTKNVFPDKLRIKILVKGKTEKNVSVKFYGTRAGGKKNNRDVYPKPFRTFSTDKVGYVEIDNVYKLYHPDHDDIGIPPKDEFPYWYWFSFVVEAEYNGQKKYVWIPDWQTQITKLKGENIHEAVVEF